MDFLQILVSAIKDGDVSIINDILQKHKNNMISFKVTGMDLILFIHIACRHRQLIVVKSLLEHTSCNLDLKLELVDFVEKGKTRMWEIYLELMPFNCNFQDTEFSHSDFYPKMTTDLIMHVYHEFSQCFVGDHMEHQHLSRLHLIGILNLHNLFLWACDVNDYECIAMILINFSEDVVDRLIQKTKYIPSLDIFSYSCSECKEEDLFNIKRLNFAKKYGFETAASNEVP